MICDICCYFMPYYRQQQIFMSNLMVPTTTACQLIAESFILSSVVHAWISLQAVGGSSWIEIY